jgi:hypothetical protein
MKPKFKVGDLCIIISASGKNYENIGKVVTITKVLGVLPINQIFYFDGPEWFIPTENCPQYLIRGDNIKTSCGDYCSDDVGCAETYLMKINPDSDMESESDVQESALPSKA